jgi:hypothetical protein
MLEPIPFAGMVEIDKPVAWMELYYGEPNNIAWTDAELRDSGEVYKTVPLYTHPVKELTDEEITNLFRASSDHIEFARAILRKAQEK